jgi:hypothetical protein
MIIPVTVLSLSVLALWFLRLTARVIGYRLKHRVSLGDGGHDDLRLAIRAQGNFSEYVPIGVLLILAAELQGANMALLALLAAAFVLGRVLHGYAFAFAAANPKLRRAGMHLTIWSMLALTVLDLAMLAIATLT